ncbi:MAG: hypothetical protein BWK78_09230 [Thiotrichaceae bacterium IS1]|nr:MAG: hypothetical protein BWK78_09230 [Thiotrichaceae bacterium IS1]
MYLEYGRSVEGKIRRMVGKTDDTTAFVTTIGWLERGDADDNKLTEVTTPSNTLVAIYGMSFAQHISEQLSKLSSSIEIRFLGGPSAPPNHSYALYQLGRGKHKAKVVAWGILASSVVGMTTMTSLNKSFEYPSPYTYPKYRVVNSDLQVQYPPITSMADFRATLSDQKKWSNYVDYLKTEDSYYQPFLFHESFIDNLATVRFFRRSLSNRYNKKVIASIYQSDTGFRPDTVEIKALQMMVAEFARQVREDNQLPLLMLFNNQGYSDHLYQTLSDVILKYKIPTMSSHNIVATDNPKNFMADGHFTPSADRKMAEETLKIIVTNENIP